MTTTERVDGETLSVDEAAESEKSSRAVIGGGVPAAAQDAVESEEDRRRRDRSGDVLAARYRLLQRIGMGGTGSVYLGVHQAIQKRVAVKLLDGPHAGHTDFAARFLQEAQAASRLRHQNIVDVTDFGETDDGSVFLVMEYLDGEDLASTLDREQRLAWPRARHIILQVLSALDCAHRGGLIHRDIKLENCFRTDNFGDPDFIKVLDFGNAKQIESRGHHSREFSSLRAPTADGVIIGTAAYISPEQAQQLPLDQRSDLYSVGVMLFELLTGQLPFDDPSFMGLLSKHIHDWPPSPREVAPEAHITSQMEALILKLLAKTPEDRYDSAGAVIRAMRNIPTEIHDEAPRGRPSPEPTTGRQQATRIERPGLTERPAPTRGDASDVRTRQVMRPPGTSEARPTPGGKARTKVATPGAGLGAPPTASAGVGNLRPRAKASRILASDESPTGSDVPRKRTRLGLPDRPDGELQAREIASGPSRLAPSASLPDPEPHDDTPLDLNPSASEAISSSSPPADGSDPTFASGLVPPPPEVGPRTSEVDAEGDSLTTTPGMHPSFAGTSGRAMTARQRRNPTSRMRSRSPRRHSRLAHIVSEMLAAPPPDPTRVPSTASEDTFVGPAPHAPLLDGRSATTEPGSDHSYRLDPVESSLPPTSPDSSLLSPVPFDANATQRSNGSVDLDLDLLTDPADAPSLPSASASSALASPASASPASASPASASPASASPAPTSPAPTSPASGSTTSFPSASPAAESLDDDTSGMTGFEPASFDGGAPSLANGEESANTEELAVAESSPHNSSRDGFHSSATLEIDASEDEPLLQKRRSWPLLAGVGTAAAIALAIGLATSSSSEPEATVRADASPASRQEQAIAKSGSNPGAHAAGSNPSERDLDPSPHPTTKPDSLSDSASVIGRTSSSAGSGSASDAPSNGTPGVDSKNEASSGSEDTVVPPSRPRIPTTTTSAKSTKTTTSSRQKSTTSGRDKGRSPRTRPVNTATSSRSGSSNSAADAKAERQRAVRKLQAIAKRCGRKIGVIPETRARIELEVVSGKATSLDVEGLRLHSTAVNRCLTRAATGLAVAGKDGHLSISVTM